MVKPDNLEICKEYLERFKQLSDAESFKSTDKEYFRVLKYVSEEIPVLMSSSSSTEGGSSGTKRGPYHALIKGYIGEILSFIDTESVASPDAQAVLITGLPRWAPLLSSFPESRKKLAERLVSIWSGLFPDQSRLSALLSLHKLVSLYPKLVEGVLKKMYQSFGRACRTLSVHTMGTATFLLNGLVEVFSIDPAKSAVLVKKALKQLAALLSSSIKQPSKESLGKVYCWTFIWNVKFLARLVSHAQSLSVPGADTLRSLQSQILSLIHTCLCYNFVPRFYAHHFHLIGAASEICRTTNAYFPASPFLLTVLKRIVSTSTKPETGKPRVFDFTTICKIPKTESTSRSYLDCAAEEALFLIGESLIGFSHLPSFPELAQPISSQLRSIEAINKTWKVSKLCSSLAMKLDQHSRNLVEVRLALPEAAPSKVQSKTSLNLPLDKDVLDQFHKHTQRVREQRRKMVASGTENKTYQEPDLGDSDVEEAIKSKPKRISKNKSDDGEPATGEKKMGTKKRAIAESEEAGLVEGVRQILASAKKVKSSKKTSSEPKEDRLEDFDLSDF